MKEIIINNSKDAAIKNSKWGNPGAKLYDNLLDAFYCEDLDNDDINKIVNNPNNLQWPDYLQEAYLIAPIKKIKNSPYGRTPYSRSGCKYPHHSIKGDELVLDVNGVRSAYIRARQMGILKGDVENHIMTHIIELGLEENLHIKDDIKMEENFQFVESFIETFNDMEFTEASHGSLKSSFRYGIDIKTGHKIKIVFDLKTTDTKFIGHDFGGGSSTIITDRRIVNNINKTGNNDFVSQSVVKAIIDEDTGIKLQSVKMIGSLNKYLNNIKEIINDYDHIWDLAKTEKVFESFLMNSLKMREAIVKLPSWKPSANIINEYRVGEKENDPSYKSTRAVNKISDLVDNMNSEHKIPNFNSRGVIKGKRELVIKFKKLNNEVKSMRNSINKINNKDDHNTVNNLSTNFANILKSTIIDLKNDNNMEAMGKYSELVDIKNDIKKIMNKYKSESSQNDPINENFAFIESFIYSTQSMQEDEFINEGYVFSQDNLEVNLDQWSIDNKNLLFITGQAGSGKSTLARNMAMKHNAIWVGLDFFECTDPTLKNIDNWKKKYEEGNIEYQCIPYILEYYKVRPELLKNWDELIKDESKYHNEFLLFLRWLIDKLRNEDKLFIIEGVQLAFYVDYNEYESYPLIIMGSSMIKSTFRRIKRANDKHGIGSAIRNLLLSIKKRKMFINDEKILDTLKDNVKNKDVDLNKFQNILNMLNGVHYGMYNKKLNKVLYSETKGNEINLLDYLDEYGDSEFIIMKPDDVIKYKAGTCWDTSLFIYSKLIENGFDPQMVFYVTESNGNIITHSTVAVKCNNGIYYNIEYSKFSSRGVNRIDKIYDIYPNDGKLLYVNNDIKVKDLLLMNEIRVEDFIKITGWNPTKYIQEKAELNEELVPIFGLAKNYITASTRPDGTPIPPSSSQRFSKIIKKLTRGDNYSHALISMDNTFKNMYSFEDEGFVKDDLWTREGWDYTGSIYIAVMFVSPEDRDKMQKFIDKLSEIQDETEYANINLIKAFIGKPIKDDKRFVCSSFTGYILSLADSKNVHRDYSRLRPEDVTILPRAFYVMNVENREDFMKRYKEILSRVDKIYQEHKEELLDYNNYLPKLLLKDKMTKLKTIDKIMDWIIAKI